MSIEPFLGVASLRQLLVVRPQGFCDELLLDDIRQIHTAARQLFHGVLGQRVLDPATLEKMLWSLERQIEAGQDLQAQLEGRNASGETQAELADLIAYFEAVCRTLVGRSSTRQFVFRP
ncbi:hypothetical protein Rumeso_00693 [Rubellimicrobium mesophilum DSM 19309]|uniref:Uncharacterized protein n=1 Tax=Rubellimicrobium mesophilum DSM 19309 TaxID=442562 RepID=A0A017HTS2_9RHOB|nr:hypothetical protein [Rubellimicrobium mesophilum]EYD77735.1 hypothetical protein Rumeso_00693 [Rubellimicrobium mesophilum DSM 19309]